MFFSFGIFRWKRNLLFCIFGNRKSAFILDKQDDKLKSIEETAKGDTK